MSVMSALAHGLGRMPAWPVQSLFARVVLVVLGTLVVTQSLMFVWMSAERRALSQRVMHSVVIPDVAGAVMLLERLPPAEREPWLEKLARPGYRYRAGALPAGSPVATADARWMESGLVSALGPARVSPVNHPGRTGGDDQLHIGLMLADGTPYTLELDRELVVSGRLGVFHLAVQLVLLGGVACVAARWALRPLDRLVEVASEFDPRRPGACWPGGGTRETARIACAFNRIQGYMAWQGAQRRQVFAAVSHELERPLTRLRLRMALLWPDALRLVLQADLEEAGACMRVGMTYAHATSGLPADAVQPTELHALLDALACSYAEEGQLVCLMDRQPLCLLTRPALLRQVLTYLIDGSLCFPGEVELRMFLEDDGSVRISVLDRGPDVGEVGCEAERALCERVEAAPGSVGRSTWLGLRVVRPLATALGAGLCLHDRPGGGLEAELHLPGKGWPLPASGPAVQVPEPASAIEALHQVVGGKGRA